MNAEHEINFSVDGRMVSQNEIRIKELERYRVAFKKMTDAGATLLGEIGAISCEEACDLPLEKAKDALARSKAAIGRQGMVDLLHDSIAQSDAMWKEIARSSPCRKNLQAGIVEVHAKGVTLPQFMLVNQKNAKANNLEGPSRIHPEHYSFFAGAGGSQTIIETFGMYGEPSYLYLKTVNDGWTPIAPDADTAMTMLGSTYLANGKIDTKVIGYHQFKPCNDGIKVKLGVFLPQAAPEAMLEGHKWHLLVEFNNALDAAAKERPSFIQSIVFNAAIKRMKRRG